MSFRWPPPATTRSTTGAASAGARSLRKRSSPSTGKAMMLATGKRSTGKTASPPAVLNSVRKQEKRRMARSDPGARIAIRGFKRAPQGVASSAKRSTRRKPMKFRPLHDRVVVRRIEAEEKTKGGIIIPDTAKEKPQEGEV